MEQGFNPACTFSRQNSFRIMRFSSHLCIKRCYLISQCMDPYFSFLANYPRPPFPRSQKMRNSTPFLFAFNRPLLRAALFTAIGTFISLLILICSFLSFYFAFPSIPSIYRWVRKLSRSRNFYEAGTISQHEGAEGTGRKGGVDGLKDWRARPSTWPPSSHRPSSPPPPGWQTQGKHLPEQTYLKSTCHRWNSQGTTKRGLEKITPRT